MIYIYWFIIFLLGISIIYTIAPGIRLLEKIGFSFPIGIGVATLIMLGLDLAGVKINQPKLLSAIFLVISMGLSVVVYKKYRAFIVFDFSRLKKVRLKSFLPVNLSWVLLIAIGCYFIAVIFKKTFFWPVFIFDSIHGYDFIAKTILHEGTFNSSIFTSNYPIYSVRSFYPPLIPLAFGLSYLFEHESSKIIVAIFYFSSFIVFYSFVRHYSSHLAAALAVLLFTLTPEFAAFSALSSPNPPCTFFSAMGFLSMYLWYRNNKMSYFYIGTISIVLAMWTRSEAIIFFGAGGIMVLAKAIQTKQFKQLVIYSISGIAVFAFWQWYLHAIIAIENSSPILTELVWDSGKLSRMLEIVKKVTWNTQYYGIVFYLFVAVVVLNSYFAIKEKNMLVFLGAIVSAYLAYLIIYYQLDTDYLPGSVSWVESGYKRGLFYFIPIALFFITCSKVGQLTFNKLLKI